MHKRILILVLFLIICLTQVLIADTPTNTPTPYAYCFDSASMIQTTPIYTTNTAWEDTGVAISFYVPITTSAWNCVAAFDTSPTSGANTRTAAYRFVLDGTPDTNYGESGTQAPDEDTIKIAKIFPITTTGAHTVKLQHMVDNGSQQTTFYVSLLGHALYEWAGTNSQLPYSTMNIPGTGITLTAATYVKVTGCALTLPYVGKISIQGFTNAKWGSGANTRNIDAQIRIDGATTSITAPITKSLINSWDKTTLSIRGVTPYLAAGSHSIEIWAKTSVVNREIVVYNGNLAAVGMVTNSDVILDSTSVTLTARQSVTSGTFVNITNAIVNRTLSSIAKILVFFSGDITNGNAAGSDGQQQILVNATPVGVISEQFVHGTGSEVFYNAAITDLLPVGTHIIQAQALSKDGTSALSYGNMDLVAYELCSESPPTFTFTPTITATSTITPTHSVSPTVTPTPKFNIALSADKSSVIVGETIKISVSWSIDGQSAYGWRVFSDGNGATNFGYIATAVPTPLPFNLDVTRPGLGWIISENEYNPYGVYEYYYAVTETTVATDNFLLSAFFYVDDVVIEQQFLNLGPVITQTATCTATPTVTVTPGGVLLSSQQTKLFHATVTDPTDSSGSITWDSPFNWRPENYLVFYQYLTMPADATVLIDKQLNYFNYRIVNSVSPTVDVDCSTRNAMIDFLVWSSVYTETAPAVTATLTVTATITPTRTPTATITPTRTPGA